MAFTTLFDFESKTESPVEPAAQPIIQSGVLLEPVQIAAALSPELAPQESADQSLPEAEDHPEADESSATEELPAVEIIADEDYAPE